MSLCLFHSRLSLPFTTSCSVFPVKLAWSPLLRAFYVGVGSAGLAGTIHGYMHGPWPLSCVEGYLYMLFSVNLFILVYFVEKEDMAGFVEQASACATASWHGIVLSCLRLCLLQFSP